MVKNKRTRTYYTQKLLDGPRRLDNHRGTYHRCLPLFEFHLPTYLNNRILLFFLLLTGNNVFIIYSPLLHVYRVITESHNNILAQRK